MFAFGCVSSLFAKRKQYSDLQVGEYDREEQNWDRKKVLYLKRFL